MLDCKGTDEVSATSLEDLMLLAYGPRIILLEFSNVCGPDELLKLEH